MVFKEAIPLKNGHKFPIIGLGTWQSDPAEVKAAVNAALETGYRHIDTAFAYLNEDAIGEVLQEWFSSGKIKREELFVVTKLPIHAIRASDVERFLKESLKRLKLDYVDIYLIHCPAGVKPLNDDMNNIFQTNPDGTISLDMETDLAATWKAMEEQVDAGRAKAVGVSNFNCAQIEKLMKTARITPATNQVELHAHYLQKPLREVCGKHGISITAYAPLGSPGRAKFYAQRGQEAPPIPDLLQNPAVTEIAKKYNKTNAQVLLRHLAQHEIVVIPKSVNPTRIKENFNIFDFELDQEEMAKLDALDEGTKGRSFDFLVFKGIDNHPEYPFTEVY